MSLIRANSAFRRHWTSLNACLILGALVGGIVPAFPLAGLFFPLLIGTTAFIAVLSERRTAIGLIVLCMTVLVYRTVFFHYEEVEINSSLHFEYLRRVELGQLPIVDYPAPVPWFEAQPLSYLLLHYLSSLALLPPPLAAKLLRILLGLTNLFFVFVLALALSRSKRIALLAATLFVTSFIEFWDSLAVQFKQGTGQAFWYAFLALFFLALSEGSLGRRPVALSLVLGLVGAALGHRLFLFMTPMLLIPSGLGAWYLERRTQSAGWLLFPIMLAVGVPQVLALMEALAVRWPWAASLRESAIFAGLRTPERLTRIGPFGWLGQLLAFASGAVTLIAMLTVRPVSAPCRLAWHIAGGMVIVAVSFSALSFFGLPIESGRILQLVWPLICVFVAAMLHEAARAAKQNSLGPFTVALPLVSSAWALVNLWNVMVDPEVYSIELALRTPLPDLLPLIFGSSFQERGFLIEALTTVVVLAGISLIGAPMAHAIGALVGQDRLVRQVLCWSAPLWGLLFLAFGGTMTLTAVRVGVIDRGLSLPLGVVLGGILGVSSGLLFRPCAFRKVSTSLLVEEQAPRRFEELIP